MEVRIESKKIEGGVIISLELFNKELKRSLSLRTWPLLSGNMSLELLQDIAWVAGCLVTHVEAEKIIQELRFTYSVSESESGDAIVFPIDWGKTIALLKSNLRAIVDMARRFDKQRKIEEVIEFTL